MYRLWIKKTLDVIFSLIGLFITFPLLLSVSIFVAVKVRGNPFFFQQRPGLHGHIFTLIKLRTMTNDKDKEGNLLSDKERITSWGEWLRKTSVDELPQLVNVLKGEMSLIGPRPLLIEYLPLYSSAQKKRHDVCPGITGWAQVNGRNTISWKQKFEYDVWYVEHLTFKLDLKIVWMTIESVFSRRDINYDEDSTMPKFNGYN